MKFQEVTRRRAVEKCRFHYGKTGAVLTVPHDALKQLGVDYGAKLRIMYASDERVLRLSFATDGAFELIKSPRGQSGIVRCGCITLVPEMPRTLAPWSIVDGDGTEVDIRLGEGIRTDGSPVKALPPPERPISSVKASISAARARVPAPLEA